MNKFEQDALAVFIFDALYVEDAVDKDAFKLIKDLLAKYYESID